MSTTESHSRGGGVSYVGVVLLLCLVPFVPLALAGIEEVLWNTHRVEDFFRTIGLHQVLGRLYEPLLRLW